MEAETRAGQAPIRLTLTGGDLLLSGRFDHWQAIALIPDGTDAGVAHVLVDATSPRGRNGLPDLFSFSAKKIRVVGDRSYAARGTLRADGIARNAEVLVQSPDGHTPFFFLTIPIDRSRHGALWTALADATVPDGGAEMAPRAWLRRPTLAAA